MSNAKFKNIPVSCPKCKSIALHWNGVTKMQYASKCANCGAYVIFNPETQRTTTKNVPQRAESSGRRFY